MAATQAQLAAMAKGRANRAKNLAAKKLQATQPQTIGDPFFPQQEVRAPYNPKPAAVGTGTLEAPVKRKEIISDDEKVYSFQLVNEFPRSWKPVDKRSGNQLASPYPPTFQIPNEGIALDEDFVDTDGNVKPRARKWRYIEGLNSIWEDEQTELANMSKDEIYELLGQEQNDLVFKDGKLNVRGVQKLKLQALMVQDTFEGKKRQYNPKLRLFKLNNPDKIVNEQMSHLQKEYAAMKLAHECSDEKMVECCFIMGIGSDDKSDSGIRRMRLEFLQKAKYDASNPKATEALDWFMNIVESPVTHVHYVFANAVKSGILSGDQIPGKLTWAVSRTPILEVNTMGDIPYQLLGLYNDGDRAAIQLFDELEKLLD